MSENSYVSVSLTMGHLSIKLCNPIDFYNIMQVWYLIVSFPDLCCLSYF